MTTAISVSGNGMTETDISYAVNQCYNVATAAAVAYDLYQNPEGRITELSRDIVIHLGQALLRRDGYFGLKIEALHIDLKLPLPGGKMIMDVVNCARIVEIIVKNYKGTCVTPAGAQLPDEYNHIFNFYMNKFVSNFSGS